MQLVELEPQMEQQEQRIEEMVVMVEKTIIQEEQVDQEL
jgi:hypothetical protein